MRPVAMADATPSVLRRPQLQPKPRKKRAFSARPFFATILLVCTVAAASLLLPAASPAAPLLPRDLAAKDQEVPRLPLPRDPTELTLL